MLTFARLPESAREILKVILMYCLSSCLTLSYIDTVSYEIYLVGLLLRFIKLLGYGGLGLERLRSALLDGASDQPTVLRNLYSISPSRIISSSLEVKRRLVAKTLPPPLVHLLPHSSTRIDESVFYSREYQRKGSDAVRSARQNLTREVHSIPQGKKPERSNLRITREWKEQLLYVLCM